MPSEAKRLDSETLTDDSFHECILFSLGGELYGTPLLSVREVIKLGETKPVPYMVQHFKGVINLRGQIVSVIDLRVKFGLAPTPGKNNMILIVETAEGLLGAIIDDLVSVEKIPKADIAPATGLETKVPLEFFSGIGKLEDRLVNLIDLAGCLSSEDLRLVKSNQVKKEDKV